MSHFFPKNKLQIYPKNKIKEKRRYNAATYKQKRRDPLSFSKIQPIGIVERWSYQAS